MSVALSLTAADRPSEGVDGAVDSPFSTDAELVRRTQHGDEQAFATLVERHRRAVYRAAYAARLLKARLAALGYEHE